MGYAFFVQALRPFECPQQRLCLVSGMIILQ